jgi:hypothetical protein
MAEELTVDFGQSFSDKNLRHMIRFAEAFRDRQIVYVLSRQLVEARVRLEGRRPDRSE